ncbi:MAG TPA: MCE family protein [Sporichthyaceae bacterium]|jgi:phospholipid/cholesterol/gamma-HCH transport system substrate-binding protein
MSKSIHGPSRAGYLTRGVIYLGVVAALIALVLAQFTGAIGKRVDVSVQLSDTGDALVTGSDVKMRGVVVGRVDSIHRDLGKPGARVTLRLIPAKAHAVPAAVTARSLPANVFGQDFIELLPPAATSGPSIRDGAVIVQDTSAETVELEDVFGKLYRVLTAVQPAKLSQTLGALAQALGGRGDQINALIGRTDAYLKQLKPQLPLLQQDITGFAGLAETFATQSPKLLDSVDDVLVLLRTLVARQAQFIELLSGGLGLARNAKDLLSNNSDNLIRVSHQGAQVIGAFGKHPRAFGDGFVNLGDFLGGLAIHPGGKIGLDTQIVPDPLRSYGPADCPRYPGLDGPNCASPLAGKPPASAAAIGGPNLSLPLVTYGGIGSVGSVSDRLALGQILAVLDRGAGRDYGDVGLLLAGSLLRGLTVMLP